MRIHSLVCVAFNCCHPVSSGGVSPVSHNALDRIKFMIFLPFCQVIQLLYHVLKCGRVTTMTRSTCTCHEILEFVVFLPKFLLFQIDYHRRPVGKPSSSSHRQALVKIWFRHLDVGPFHETDGYWSWKWRWVKQFILHLAYTLLIFRHSLCFTNRDFSLSLQPKPCHDFVSCERFQSMTESK